MYAQIDHSKDIGRTLHYHERKVEKGLAECLLAGNAVKDLDKLDWQDKLYHFQRLNVRNARSKKNTLHISLSFHHFEKLSNTQIQVVAVDYIQKMGFYEQPFLIYRHYDTLHPHLHIVCSNIHKDGHRMSLKKADFYKSKKVSMELEEKHSLLPFEKAIQQEAEARPQYRMPPGCRKLR